MTNPWGAPATEAELRAAVEDYLRRRRDLMWTRTDAAGKDPKQRGRHVRKGWPDITIALRGGRTVLIELKTARGKLSDEQLRTLEEASKLCVVAAVCRSVGEVHDVIERAMQ